MDVDLHCEVRPARPLVADGDHCRWVPASVPSSAMRCRRCGHENEAGANYCSSCGTPLTGEDDETTITLAALEDRQAVEEEFGALLAEVPSDLGVLVVRRGPNQGSSFVLDRPVTTLGRHPDSDIFLDDVTVSRRHAEISRDERGYEIRDAGSLNGTYVDHERVEAASLHDLNEIQIGRFVLTFVFGAGPEAGSDAGGSGT